jgi:TonB family protein
MTRLCSLLAVSAWVWCFSSGLSAQQINRDDPAHPIRVKAIEFVAVDDTVEQDLRKLLPIREGDTVRDSDLVRAAQTVGAFDKSLAFGVGWEPANDLRDARIRISGVGGNRPAVYYQPAQLRTRVEPVYPPRARSEHVQGTVRLSFIVGADGTVQNPEVSSGPSLLTEAAIAAVEQWMYDPALANGEPTETRASADVEFHLNDGTPEPPPLPPRR